MLADTAFVFSNTVDGSEPWYPENVRERRAQTLRARHQSEHRAGVRLAPRVRWRERRCADLAQFVWRRAPSICAACSALPFANRGGAERQMREGLVQAPPDVTASVTAWSSLRPG